MTTKQAQQRQEVPDGATGKAQELATQAKEQAQETVDDAKGRASDRLREQLDSQSTNLAERIRPFPGALRKAGEYLDSQGNGPAAKAAARGADRGDQLASYLEEASSDRILGDLEAFARRRPWVVGGIATAAGFVASRFLTASSERRYQSRHQPEQRSHLDSSARAGSNLDETSGLPRALSEMSYGGH